MRVGGDGTVGEGVPGPDVLLAHEQQLTERQRERQCERERTSREAALGSRVREFQEGHATGKLTRRFINASVGPVAARLVLAAEAYLAGDMAKFCSILDSPVFELRARMEGEDGYGDGSRTSLRVIFQWLIERDRAPDIVLASLGTAILRVSPSGLRVGPAGHRRSKDDAGAGDEGVPMTGLLGAMGEAARETCMGQFFQEVQGAEALAKITLDRKDWSRRNKLRAIAGIVGGQVRQQFEAEDRGETNLEHVGTRTVLKIVEPTRKGGTVERMWTGHKPTLEDWQMLEVSRRLKGERDPHRAAWMTFSLVVLCAAQAEHGWFELARVLRKRGRNSGHAHALVLAEEAKHAIQLDVDKWLHMGFIFEPMIVPPEKGDYLTVKHRRVTGRRGPMGWHTEITDESQGWQLASEVMAKTAWRVDQGTLMAAKEETHPLHSRAAESFGGDERALKEVLAAYSRDAEFGHLYFPIYMDFRGRVYPRTTWVSYQGSDLQKGLLRFPYGPGGIVQPCSDATVMHLGNLYGNRLDKEPLAKRWQWWEDYGRATAIEDFVLQAEEPVQMFTALHLIAAGQEDSIPCQIDGTCNGLQHLSALFRDELAAPFVNLVPSDLDSERPSDLYSEVAKVVLTEMDRLWRADWKAHTWIGRVLKGNIMVDRKVCKAPVMVLPYGGSLESIVQGVTRGCLAQEPIARAWRDCLTMRGDGKACIDEEAVANGFLAFQDRTLGEHPLFHNDMRKLALVVLEAIKRVIPRAMAAMDAFKAIAGLVGERSLEWYVPAQGIWVVHAYPLSARSTLKTRGFHLPGSIRALALKHGKDEIDRHAHRSGIVANFIHSQDAAHLVATMGHFRLLGGRDFGAIHDCFITRPSQMDALGTATRMAFGALYRADPLSQPVRLRSLDGKVENFDSWYALAASMKVAFPDMGSWKPEEVHDAAWFFS